MGGNEQVVATDWLSAAWPLLFMYSFAVSTDSSILECVDVL